LSTTEVPGPARLTDRQIQDAFGRLDEVLAGLETIPDPGLRDQALTAVELLLEIYGEGIRRIADLSRSPDGTPAPGLVQDQLVGHLLVLHDAHPVDVRVRAEEALDAARPYLKSHGGGVELLEVEEGVARVRLTGSCNGCPSSATTLKSAVEEVLTGAVPEIARVEAAEPEAGAGDDRAEKVAFIPLASIGRRPAGALAAPDA